MRAAGRTARASEIQGGSRSSPACRRRRDCVSASLPRVSSRATRTGPTTQTETDRCDGLHHPPAIQTRRSRGRCSRQRTACRARTRAAAAGSGRNLCGSCLRRARRRWERAAASGPTKPPDLHSTKARARRDLLTRSSCAPLGSISALSSPEDIDTQTRAWSVIRPEYRATPDHDSAVTSAAQPAASLLGSLFGLPCADFEGRTRTAGLRFAPAACHLAAAFAGGSSGPRLAGGSLAG